MRFYNKLYIGSSIARKKRQIVWKLKKKKPMHNIYCIALADRHRKDMLDIFHNVVLKQSYYQENPPYIIGIAGSYTEAVDLILTMLQDAMNQTGTYDVRKICHTQSFGQ